MLGVDATAIEERARRDLSLGAVVDELLKGEPAESPEAAGPG
jgi:hypothetical protein